MIVAAEYTQALVATLTQEPGAFKTEVTSLKADLSQMVQRDVEQQLEGSAICSTVGEGHVLSVFPNYASP